MRGFVRSDHDIWLSATEAAAAQNFNVVTFAGRALQSPSGFQDPSNAIYKLISPSRLDGVIVLSSGLALYTGLEGIRDFVKSFENLPLVSLQMALQGVPSILVDDYRGMREVVDHLIEVHHYRQIAFVRGPVTHGGAEDRYCAYCESLADHNIHFDPALVSPPGKRWSNEAGIERFLSALGSKAHNLDALIGASAGLAQQAMHRLSQHGLRIPEDVAVAGFDDFPFIGSVLPQLTTARVPFDVMGRRAVSMLAAQVRGEKVESLVTIPAHLITRQSCGCPSRTITLARLPSLDPRPEISDAETVRFEVWFAQQRDSLLASMIELVQEGTSGSEAGALDWIRDLIASLASDVRDLSANPHVMIPSNSRFLSRLNQILRRLANQNRELGYFQDLISLVRRTVLRFPQVGDSSLSLVWSRWVQALEDLFGQARVMVSEAVGTVAVADKMSVSQRMVTLSRLGHILTTEVGLEDMMNTLAESLPAIGIKGCYLVFYEDPDHPAGWARLRFALSSNQRIEVASEGERFRATDILPLSVLQDAGGLGSRYHWIAEPLFVRDQHFGYMLVEMGPSDLLFEDQSADGTGTVYDLLRDYLSDALHGIFLYEEARRARQKAEQADQLKSRFLSMVSHELRTPLNVVVSLSEMLLWQDDAHRQEMERIHASAQHLDGLIRDVLDLASSHVGQLHLIREPLDLTQSLEVVTLIGEQMAQDKGLQWHVEIPDSLPNVWGDRTRIRQVALNLVSNAFRFTSEGEVCLRIEVGEQDLRVLVSDTGIGVPVGEQGAIFDEFQQSERTAGRGYGGLGLGLAISRRLVEMHGGTMGVESSGVEGEGAIFYFTLPLMDKGDRTCAYAAETGSEGRGADAPVWMITEHAGNGAKLQGYLTDRGYQVEEIVIDDHDAADLSQHWLSRMGRCRPGALILDLEPAQDRGWEIMKVIKENPETQHIPVLFYSLLQEETSGSMLALDYLTKPVGMDDLTEALERQGLSMAVVHAEASDAAACPDSVSLGATFLVVDDEPESLAMHSWLLQSRIPQSRILRATSGRQALDLMTRSRPDLVLLDLMMPEMSGFEVIETMCQHPDLCDIPVIVLTAKTLDGDTIARLNKGVTAVLGKGLFSADETLHYVEMALQRSYQTNLDTRRTVRGAMAYIHEHYRESITRRDIADHLGYSPRHLDRRFNEEMGLTPMAYLNRFRLRQSRRLLQSTCRSIGEIADAVGFSDSAYFSRVFKQEMGVSPSEYRRTL
jgi:signal transduction histidine kinase/DNA-binding LacI/PurR family transcriptional regulator/AraC-like DNA-binding protein/DNA-binding LytR/AlgR family response regulator